MSAYYNEHDPKAAAWLRELIVRGLIAEGDVDERSILDVRPDDLRGYTQCHFFAGIGGWSYALRLAGWPDDRPVWTGSPPCQPFSAAGRRLGRDDERHLAPHFVGLVRAFRPEMLFGEQVASAEVFGGSAKRAGASPDGAPRWAWLDDLCDRLEASHYAVGATDIPAAGVGAPHIRQRTFFGAVRLADAEHAIGGAVGEHRKDGRDGQDDRWPEAHGIVGTCGQVHGLADAMHTGWSEWRASAGDGSLAGGCSAGWLADADDGKSRQGGGTGRESQTGDEPRPESCGRGSAGRLADADDAGSQGRPRAAGGADQRAAWAGGMADRPSPTDGFWRDADWLFCRDAKWRPVEPGTFPLADGLPARVGRLRGYGNAIVPQVAAQFVIAFMEVQNG